MCGIICCRSFLIPDSWVFVWFINGLFRNAPSYMLDICQKFRSGPPADSLLNKSSILFFPLLRIWNGFLVWPLKMTVQTMKYFSSTNVFFSLSDSISYIFTLIQDNGKRNWLTLDPQNGEGTNPPLIRYAACCLQIRASNIIAGQEGIFLFSSRF